MSIQTLSRVLRARGLSDREFRVLVNLANYIGERWSMVEIDQLAADCELSEEALKYELSRLIGSVHGLQHIRINSPAHRCPGPNRVEGHIAAFGED